MKHLLYIIMPLSIIAIVACHGDYNDLGNGFIYSERAVFYQNKDCDYGRLVIEDDVCGYGLDSDYITIFQMPNHDSYEECDSLEYGTGEEKIKSRYSNDVIFKKSISERESLIKSTHSPYWIIDKKKHLVFGPMNKKEYQHLYDSLKIDAPIKMFKRGLAILKAHGK